MQASGRRARSGDRDGHRRAERREPAGHRRRRRDGRRRGERAGGERWRRRVRILLRLSDHVGRAAGPGGESARRPAGAVRQREPRRGPARGAVVVLCLAAHALVLSLRLAAAAVEASRAGSGSSGRDGRSAGAVVDVCIAVPSSKSGAACTVRASRAVLSRERVRRVAVLRTRPTTRELEDEQSSPSWPPASAVPAVSGPWTPY